MPTPQRRWATSWVGIAAVDAIASEVANIQLWLYQITGNDHTELDDHPLLTLLESVNEYMTGIEFKYTMMAHLELTGNFYCLSDGVNEAIQKERTGLLRRCARRNDGNSEHHYSLVFDAAAGAGAAGAGLATGVAPAVTMFSDFNSSGLKMNNLSCGVSIACTQTCRLMPMSAR
jgi:hypothetical protein